MQKVCRYFYFYVIELTSLLNQFAVDDFVMVSRDLRYEIQTQTQDICITVQTNSDMTLEEDESFIVTIIANPPVNSSLSRLVASVIILNDDSKYM